MTAPRHVAIIMDGNGRWAEAHGLPRSAGHREGAEAVLRAVKSAKKLGVAYLTLYAFSTENWKRPRQEVDGLMQLLEDFLDQKLPEMKREGVRFRAIGRLEELRPGVRKRLKKAIDETAANDAGTLTLGLNYGGRAEIVDAAKQFAKAVETGAARPEQLDEKLFTKYLYDPDLPDPDLLIRTSGEFRLSNFLLWELAYSELVIIDKQWPDFGHPDFEQAIKKYQTRDRRFGGRQPQKTN